MGMVTILLKHLDLCSSYVCEYSHYTKAPPPSLPRSGPKVCGGWWCLNPTLVFSFAQAEKNTNIRNKYNASIEKPCSNNLIMLIFLLRQANLLSL